MSQAEISGRGIPAGRAEAAAAIQRTKRNAWLRPLLMVGGVMIVGIVALFFWLTGGRYQSSDDSYVEAAKVSLSTDVPGLVAAVYVRDNQHVQAGQILFSLDQSAFDIQVQAARAQLAQAVLDIKAAKQSYAQAQAKVSASRAQIAQDKANVARYASVVSNGGVTRQTYEDAQFKLQGDEAKLGQSQADAGMLLAKLAGNAEVKPEDTPEYLSALAQFKTAMRDKSHSIVRAPFSGQVTQVEQLQPGMFLSAGTAAFGIVSASDVWVTMQPKENNLTWVRDGQAATITVDTYPGATWKGIVQSVSPASSSEFSILPAQNSSGNWVKVVQRIPVRIRIVSGPSDLPLRDGMSTEVTIDTRHHRHFGDLF